MERSREFEHTVTADPDQAQNEDIVMLPEGAEPFDSGTCPPAAVSRGSNLFPALPESSSGLSRTPP